MMDQENNVEQGTFMASKDKGGRDLKLFILVMIVFTLGMAALLFFEVSAWWIWYLYFAIWTIIEIKIAKNIKLKWWQWALIIAAIISMDWVVLELVDYIN